MRLFLLYSSILLTTISVTTTASSSGTPLDFRIGDTVELKVDDSNPENWKITLDYVYHGPSLDQLSYDVLLLDYATCTTAKTTTGPISPATPAISSSSDGSFTLNLDVDVWSLQQSENDFMVQTEATESTELTAFVEFCARVDLKYDEVLVNFALAQISIGVGGYGAFVAFNQDVSVTSPKPIASSSTVSVGYDLELFLCDTSSLELPTEAAVAPITPGTPIRFCISVADTETGVHVDTIQTVSYSSAAVGNEQTPQVIIDKGVALTTLAAFNCNDVRGVCRVEFIVPADYFVKDAFVNVQGSVVVALNGDNDNNARRDADMAAYQQSKNNNNNNNRGLVAPADQENQDATSFSFQIALAPNEKGGEETKAMTLRKEGPTESTNGDGGMKAVAVLAMVAFAATVFMLTSSWMISHNKKQASSQ